MLGLLLTTMMLGAPPAAVAKTASVEKAPVEMTALRGSWKVVEIVLHGKPESGERLNGVVLEIKDGEMTLKSVADPEPKSFKFTLVSDATPKGIDMIALDGPYKGSKNPAIYALDGDTLKLCSPNAPGGARPAALRSDKGSTTVLMVAKRMKP